MVHNRKIYFGVVHNLRSIDTVSVVTELGMGMKVQLMVRIEGIFARDVPETIRDDAFHGMIVLLGGKNVAFYGEADQLISPLVSRLYLNEPVRDWPDEGNVQVTVQGCDRPVLDVSNLFQLYGQCGAFADRVRRILNGSRRDGRAVHT